MLITLKQSKISLAYLVTAISLFVLGFMTKASYEIAVHDTYFIFGINQICFIIGFYFSAMAVIHLIIEKTIKKFNSIWGWSHYVLTIFCMLAIVILITQKSPHPVVYNDYSSLDYGNNYDRSVQKFGLVFIFLTVLIFNQLLFGINIIKALLVKKRR